MIVHHREESRPFNGRHHPPNSKKKFLHSNSAPDCSPTKQWSHLDRKDGVVTALGACNGLNGSRGEDVMEIKELCESPKSSRRFSMFSFTPGPTSPPAPLPPAPLCRHLADSPNYVIPSPEITLTTSSNDSSPPLERRRYMIINEVISTETKYIDNLNTILTVFLPALEHIVSPRDLRLLIPAQLEVLVEAHQEILDSLHRRMSGEVQFYGFVGDIFSHLCNHSNMEFFNMYRVYMGEFKIAMKTLSRYNNECPQFREILTLLQHSPVCERLNLASYLLTPIQRLPRYELLLKELLKYTSPYHPDNHYIGDALSKLHKVLIKLNLSIKSCQLACTKNSSFRLKRNVSRRNSHRRVSRTFSVLKKFVSAANIDDYSSSDSNYADDLIKPSRIPCQYLGMGDSSSSLCDSDINISCSLDEGTCLVGNRAVSCSDLMFSFGNNFTKHQKFLAPLASTPDSQRSSVNSHRVSSLSSSTSSLSSLEMEESLTPTEGGVRIFRPPQFSTPILLNDRRREDRSSTLKPNDDSESSPDEYSHKTYEKKTTWKRLFKLKRKSKEDLSTSEMKYASQQNLKQLITHLE